ncbi:hypothetical protein KNP414_04531 [Paenibacillus mucilaginosus KNP414]|uniref:Uncharacterized protein n=1 Tax=Paenibacillus mucilaginosus (strain KNP414) TaxID=1036673 RepID=F8F9D3_PAEMK|nr:hypothetical protein KNP414_04531 [Paenibacillus mucilaginosus KNP414]
MARSLFAAGAPFAGTKKGKTGAKKALTGRGWGAIFYIILFQ